MSTITQLMEGTGYIDDELVRLRRQNSTLEAMLRDRQSEVALEAHREDLAFDYAQELENMLRADMVDMVDDMEKLKAAHSVESAQGPRPPLASYAASTENNCNLFFAAPRAVS